MLEYGKADLGQRMLEYWLGRLGHDDNDRRMAPQGHTFKQWYWQDNARQRADLARQGWGNLMKARQDSMWA